MANESVAKYYSEILGSQIPVYQLKMPVFTYAFSSSKLPLSSPSTFSSGTKKPGSEATRKMILDWFNQTKAPLGKLSGKGHGIWSEIYGFNRFNTLHQQAIQNAMAFGTTSKYAYGLDIETIGEIPENIVGGKGYFGITEIGMERFYYDAAKGPSSLKRMPQKLGLAIAQSQEGVEEVSKWIAAGGRGDFLFDWQRRSIIDLAKYDPMKRLLDVNTSDMIGAVISDSGELISQASPLWIEELKRHQGAFTDEQIESMKRGLEHLQSKGGNLGDSLKKVGERISRANANGQPIVTHNGINFDLPRIQHAVSVANAMKKRGGLTIADPESHLDFLHLLRTVPDIYETMYAGERTRMGLGETKLEYIASMFGISGEGFAHEASHDVHTMMQSLVETLDGPIGLRKTLQDASTKTPFGDIVRTGGGLQYNETEIYRGQTFFSIGGRFATGESSEDMTLRYIKDKGYEITRYPDQSIGSGDLLRFQGALTIGEGESSRHTAVFQSLDPSNRQPQFQVITRRTRGELQEAIHSIMRPWVSGEDSDYATRVHHYDSASRRWRRMFSPEAGGGYKSLTRSLDYLDASRGDPNEFIKFQNALSPEQVRDFDIFTGRTRLSQLPGGRLESEERIWRSVVGLIDDMGLDTGFKSDIALQIASQEVEKEFQLGNHLLSRMPTSLEKFQLPIIDPITKELHYVNLADPARANDSIRNMLYGRARGGNARDIHAKVNAEFEKFINMFTSSHAAQIKTPEGMRRVNIKPLLTKEQARNFIEGETLTSRIQSFVSHIADNLADDSLLKQEMIIESLGPRSTDIANMAEDQFKVLMDRVRERTLAKMRTINGLQNNEYQRWATNYTKRVASKGLVIGDLGKQHLDDSLARLQGLYAGDNLFTAFGWAGGNGQPNAIKMVVSGKDKESITKVISYLANEEAQKRGELPPGIAEVIIGLPDEHGIITMGRRKLVAQSKLTMTTGGGKSKYAIKTAFDMQIDELADNAGRFRRYALAGDWDKASWILRSSPMDALEKLSSPTHGYGEVPDNVINAMGTLGDDQKRLFVHSSDVYVAAQKLQEEGMLDYPIKINEENWQQAWENLGYHDRIKVERAIPRLWETEIRDQLIEDGVPGITSTTELGTLGVRSSHVGNATYSIGDARALYPGSFYNKPGREGPLQALNYHILDQVPVGYRDNRYAGTLTGTPTRMSKGGGTSGIYLRGIVMDDEQILAALEGANITDLPFEKIPTTYEQQLWITQEAANDFKATVSHSYIVDDISKNVAEGKALKRGTALGTRGSGKVVFDKKGIGGKITSIEHMASGQVRVNTEVTKILEHGDKVITGSGSEKFTVRIGDKRLLTAMTGREDINYIMFADNKRHMGWGDYAHSQIASAALGVQEGRFDEDHLINALKDSMGIEAKYVDGQLILPEDWGTQTTENIRKFQRAFPGHEDLFYHNINGVGSTEIRVDEMRLANVHDTLSASNKYPRGTTANKRASIGIREIKAMSRKGYVDEDGVRRGLPESIKWIELEAKARGENPVKSARAVYNTLAAYAGEGTDTIGIKNAGDFLDLPGGGIYDIGQLRGTFFDQENLGEVYGLKLPESVKVNLRGTDSSGAQLGLTNLDTIYMPVVEHGIKDGESATLTGLQKAEQRLLVAARRMNEEYYDATIPPTGNINRLHDELSGELKNATQNFLDELATSADSHGTFNEDLIKTPISSSGYARIQILSPKIAESKFAKESPIGRLMQRENVSIMSMERAKALGLSDDIIKKMRDYDPDTGGYFGFTQRYPNIHSDTYDVVRHYISDELEGDTVIMTSGLAVRYGADSDGDFKAMYFPNSKNLKSLTKVDEDNIQKEAKGYWTQSQGRLVADRQQAAIDYEELISVRSELGRKPTTLDFIDELSDGLIAPQTSEHAKIIDSEVKKFKQLIGAMSNFQQRATDFAQVIHDSSEEALSLDQFADIQKFGRLLEQKAISVKRGMEGQDELKYIGYHLSEEPQSSIKMFKLLKDLKEEEFIEEFVKPKGAPFIDEEAAVRTFFKTAKDNHSLWQEMKGDIFWGSSASKYRGVLGVWESLNPETNIASPNRTILMERLGQDVSQMIDNTKLSGSNLPITTATMAEAADDAGSMISKAGVKATEVISKDGMKIAKMGGMALGALALAGMVINMGRRDSDIPAEDLEPQPQHIPNSSPTANQARVTPNGYKVRVNATDASGMDANVMAERMHQRMGPYSNGPINTNLRVTDDTRSMDNQWIQELFANAIRVGRV